MYVCMYVCIFRSSLALSPGRQQPFRGRRCGTSQWCLCRMPTLPIKWVWMCKPRVTKANCVWVHAHSDAMNYSIHSFQKFNSIHGLVIWSYTPSLHVLHLLCCSLFWAVQTCTFGVFLLTQQTWISSSCVKSEHFVVVVVFVNMLSHCILHAATNIGAMIVSLCVCHARTPCPSLCEQSNMRMFIGGQFSGHFPVYGAACPSCARACRIATVY